MKKTDSPAPKRLVPEFEEKNAVLYNAARNPVTISLDQSTTIDLTYLGWPTICRGDGDTLYAVASLRIGHVDPFGATAFFVSEDGGKTWSAPRIINDTPMDDRDTGILYLGNGRILVSFFTREIRDFLPGGIFDFMFEQATEAQCYAKLRQWYRTPKSEILEGERYWMISSDDYGQTWSAPYNVPGCNPHGPTQANDGTILQGHVDITQGGCLIYHSTDGGRTWEHRTTAPLKPESETCYFSESYVIQLKNGKYVLVVRSGDFADDDNRLGSFISFSDDGYTFTVGTRIEGVIGAPPHLLELSNGALLLTYTYRGKEARRGIRGRVSYDGGHTWDEEMVLSEVPDGCYPGEVGYPSTAELDDGTLITIYYQPQSSDEILRPSVMYTRWKLVESAE